MGRLTNDGAEQILLKATEDPVVLSALLQPVTAQSTEKAARIFSSFLSGQALTMAGRGSEQQQTDRSMLGIEDKLKILREQRAALTH